MKVKCIQCNKEFNRSKFELEKYNQNGNIFCSRKCVSDYKRLAIKCLTCGKEFNIRKSELKKGRKYCSLECAYKSEDRVKKNSISLICPICRKDFQVSKCFVEKYQKKFCSQECRNAFYNSTRISVSCAFCSKIIEKPQSLIENKKMFTVPENVFMNIAK